MPLHRDPGSCFVLSWSMEKSVRRIGRRKIAVSNLDKVLYPGGRVTKARRAA